LSCLSAFQELDDGSSLGLIWFDFCSTEELLIPCVDETRTALAHNKIA
jgi:hypothetical protein